MKILDNQASGSAPSHCHLNVDIIEERSKKGEVYFKSSFLLFCSRGFEYKNSINDECRHAKPVLNGERQVLSKVQPIEGLFPHLISFLD